jgi:hypothetical protein
MTESAKLFHRLMHEMLSYALSKDGCGITFILIQIAEVCEEKAEIMAKEQPEYPEMIRSWRLTGKYIRDIKDLLTSHSPVD